MPHTFLGSYAGQWFTATTPQQARLLSSRAALRHLEPFVGRKLGAAQAAREAGVSTERTLYWVRQFVEAGILTVAGEQKRGGRPICLYAAPSGFRVPFHLTPFEDIEAELAAQSRQYDELRVRTLARALTRKQLSGRLIYRDERGEVNYESDLPTQSDRLALTRRGGDFTGVKWLTPAQAEIMSAALDQVRLFLSDVPSARAPDSQPYLIQTVLTQLDEDDAPS
ncbi:hypothetical protein FNU79_00040 [Deinococcus detaillensis]|uniref:Helix-turn-helix domain-containing protein n=1 Tax=Deinococcus detaillensis TaxID=2592048 RepID=A0A553V5F1_9DEIO|nr:hypothetical protein [Deinococcus detaillensis]TSA87699.1 hypothetical protein FNU79_00040 [Deinococcus detaillensis]